MPNEIGQLKSALGFSVSAIATEHFFSAGMSSPWSVAKFAQSDQDRAQVWRLFKENAIASVAFSMVIAILLGDGSAFLFALAGSAAVIGFVYSEYKRALEGTL